MKKILAILTVLTFVCGLAGVALAQEDTFDVSKEEGRSRRRREGLDTRLRLH